MNGTNKTFWIIVTILVVTAAFLIIYIFIPDPVIKTDESAQAQPKIVEPKVAEYKVVMDGSKVVLENQGYVPLPTSTSSSPVGMPDLGNNLSPFLINGAANEKINADLYSDGSTGWNVTYEMNKNISETNNALLDLAGSLPYKIIYRARDNSTLSAVIVSEGPEYKVKIGTEPSGENLTKVSLQIQKK